MSRNFTMLTPVWYLRSISYPRVLQWVPKFNPSRKPFFSGDAYICPNTVKFSQTTTFDRKAVETPFFYKKDQNEFLKLRSPFALKCFLNWLIGQLVILGRIRQSFTMTHVDPCAITDIWGHLVVWWGPGIVSSHRVPVNGLWVVEWGPRVVILVKIEFIWPSWQELSFNHVWPYNS